MLSNSFAALVPLALAAASVANAAPQSSSSSNPLSALGPIINGLSSGCVGTIGGFALNPTDPFSSCLSLGDAISTFTSVGGSGSLVPGFNSYFTNDICGKPACSGSVLSNANSTLHSSCTASDFSSNKGENAAVLFSYLIEEYYPIRNAVCNANSQTGQNCVVETMYGIQNATGKTLSLDTLISLLGSSSSSSTQDLEKSLLSNKTLLCSDCNKAILSSALSSLPGGASSAASSLQSAASGNGTEASLIKGVEGTCGQSFLDGQYPSDTKNSSVGASSSSGGANTGSGNSKSAAAPAFKHAGAAAGLLGFVAAGAILLA